MQHYLVSKNDNKKDSFMINKNVITKSDNLTRTHYTRDVVSSCDINMKTSECVNACNCNIRHIYESVIIQYELKNMAKDFHNSYLRGGRMWSFVPYYVKEGMDRYVIKYL